MIVLIIKSQVSVIAALAFMMAPPCIGGLAASKPAIIGLMFTVSSSGGHASADSQPPSNVPSTGEVPMSMA